MLMFRWNSWLTLLKAAVMYCHLPYLFLVKKNVEDNSILYGVEFELAQLE
jgi:hypothetical protein